MLITRTPLRISLLGGGTDYPDWFQKHGGLVIGGTINKYIYVSARRLENFHDYKTRLVYKEIETISDIKEIKHAAIKSCIERTGLTEVGLEIFNAADMPSMSGTGSSSAFVVGLLNALNGINQKQLMNYELAEEAIIIERDILKETVGCQDQVWAAYGGLNIIKFNSNGVIDVNPLIVNTSELESHIMLFYTKISRNSSSIASTYAKDWNIKQKEQFAMMRIADEGLECIYRSNFTRLGELVDKSWQIKAGLSTSVTNNEINQIYLAAKLSGALGGKITGAGGGGCLLLIASPAKHSAIKSTLTKMGCVHIPFKFEFSGSKIIFADRNKL